MMTDDPAELSPLEKAVEAIERITEPLRPGVIRSILQALLAEHDAERWRPIAEAPRDGNPIWVCLHPRIYPDLRPGREDLDRWNGLQVPLRHPGIASDGFDIGWSIAAPVGHGGFPDDWIIGWREMPPLPEPPR